MKLALEIVALVIGAVAIVALLPHAPSRPRRRRRRGATAQRPAGLEQIERLVVAGRQTAGEVHVRVRPLLREIAAPLLRRRGVRLDAEPDQARTLLGPELWEIVAPDRPRPEERRAPGLDLDLLERITERLERL